MSVTVFRQMPLPNSFYIKRAGSNLRHPLRTGMVQRPVAPRPKFHDAGSDWSDSDLGSESNDSADSVPVKSGKDTPGDSSSGLCCCGCGKDASQSHHTCQYTGLKVMAFCMLASEESENFGSKGMCARHGKEVSPGGM